jgi:hypothetical protein
MSDGRDPMDRPLPESLEMTIRALRAFASHATFVAIVSLASIVVLTAIGAGDLSAALSARLSALAVSMLTSVLFAGLGYGVCVYVLSGETVGGWAAYRRTDPRNLRLFVIVSLLFGVLLSLGEAILGLLPQPISTIARIAFTFWSLVLILRYATVLPAIARGEGIDLAAADGRGQRGALLMRLFVIPFLGFVFLTMLVLALAAMGLPQALILIPATIGIALYAVSIYVVLAKAYLGAYR